jgi:hypothetical protein
VVLVMGLLIKLAAGIGVPERFRKAAAWAEIAVLAIVGAVLLFAAVQLAWSHWLGRHDDQVLTADRAAANAQASGAVIQADRKAGAAKDARDRAFADQQRQLQENADAAARASASPLDAVFDQLR